MKGTTLNFSKKCLDGGGHYSRRENVAFGQMIVTSAIAGKFDAIAVIALVDCRNSNFCVHLRHHRLRFPARFSQ